MSLPTQSGITDNQSPPLTAVESAALFHMVYGELKRLARRQLRLVDARATMCTTELVHEAYLKLARTDPASWEGRAHFFGTAARAMRQVLVDFARRRSTDKRGGDWERVTLGDGAVALEIQLDEILALDEALERLDAVDARLRQVVELRFYGGLQAGEIAQMLGVSERTIERDWLKARVFLLSELKTTGSGS